VVNAASPSNSTLGLGQPCNPASPQCAPGVSCYAVNSMQIPTCGSFQGTCTSTSQCATNECVSGFCSGPVLPFPGTQCTPTFQDASALPCAFGASCYAVNSMLITVCGNFQAECSWDGQCAFNHCQGGFCAGSLLSSSTEATSTTYYPLNSTTTSIPALTGNGTVGVAAPTTSVLYVNGTATASDSRVTSTLIVGGQTSATGGETSSRQSPTPTASAQSCGVGRGSGAAFRGACALGVVGMVMMML